MTHTQDRIVQLASGADTADSATDSIGRPSRAHSVMRGLGWTLIWLGLLAVGFVAHQEFVTTWLARYHQAELKDEVASHFNTAEITEVPYEDGDRSTSLGAAGEQIVLLKESVPEEHSAFAELRIPSLPSLVDGWAIVEGVSLSDLRTGAGHMPWTPLPGQPGNSVISGHRTTYGQPFHDLDQLEPGDMIEVKTALGVHMFAVREVHIVQPTDTWVAEPRSSAWLTLTTCHPKRSARQRLIVHAELVAGPNAEAILGRS